MIEAKTGLRKKLGGNVRNNRRGKSGPRKNSIRYVPTGYIRCKKTKGARGTLRYYFYCYAQKQPDGSFREVCEYLGTADAILKAVRSGKKAVVNV